MGSGGEFAASLAAVVVMCSGCYTVPETGRKSLDLVPADQEMQLGITEFQKMKQEVPVSKDPAANALLQQVGKRIAAVAPLPNAQWEFVVFESKEANAFCLPGGKVGIYTGILPITKDASGLATVLGHEIAHAVAHHGAERMSRAMIAQQVGSFVDLAAQKTKYASLIDQAYGLGTQVGLELPHSREQESEADHLGLIYMARAGYNPDAAVAFWERFAEYNKANGASDTLVFLRTHPLDDQRIDDIKKWLPKAEAEYRAK